jgi:hypothetical protein
MVGTRSRQIVGFITKARTADFQSAWRFSAAPRCARPKPAVQSGFPSVTMSRRVIHRLLTRAARLAAGISVFLGGAAGLAGCLVTQETKRPSGFFRS